MNVNNLFTYYLVVNFLISIAYISLYMADVAYFVKIYNLTYGVLILFLCIWDAIRYLRNNNIEDRTRAGVQFSWLIVSFALGYISIIYAPILYTTIFIVAIESLMSIIQAIWGASLLYLAYKKGYSIIKV
ncbi:hypothetical protein [Sulfolobus acidocaldarius]|uniref:Uncharacterized protein n=5 Tax=Sulfolobus acidocaldarius TaxID=2285 RepID=A0A0U3F9L6_9CREN|nr:hypothetical protein [Sulfolobus acidocaldarius]AAY81334.1 hypothetical membrane protein [Sulfolobus acidocaldarius DSM 639]AGE74248.1 hypothetical protein SacRon12I_10150 [Sulfolobus acidocaldarius Ron12/I]ALU29866.1 hypothetical protein ATY89_07885 [Sulfolobus acidocaldarius]ALU32606.1 hypothetical protein ATZ20_10905 [Sulfolobus acidocaldarius]WCM35836.1 hypothetical protein GO597_11105 [Sulfolobus acidocaldarius DSM 639]